MNRALEWMGCVYPANAGVILLLFKASVSINSMIPTFIILMLIGLMFGIFPAKNVANKNLLDVLKQENNTMKFLLGMIYLIMIIMGFVFLLLAYDEKNKTIKDLIGYGDYSLLILILYYVLKILKIQDSKVALLISTIISGLIMIIVGGILLTYIIIFNKTFI